MNNHSLKHLLVSILFLIILMTMVADMDKRLLLCSTCLLLPMALAVVPTIKRSGDSSKYHALLLRCQPYWGLVVGIAFLFPEGSTLGFILSLIWLIYTFALFGYGCRRFIERGYYRIEECAVDTSFLNAFIGGIALSIYFYTSNPVYLKISLYFHFLAMLSTLFIGFLGRILSPDYKLSRAYRWAIGGTIAGSLLIGIGMGIEQWTEQIGWWIYGLSIIMYCFFVFAEQQKRYVLPRLLIRLSAIVLVITSVLSIMYGIFLLQGHIWIQPAQWRWYHEFPIAVGLAVGMCGWYFRKPIEKDPLYQMPQTNIIGGSYIGSNFLQENGYEAEIASHSGIIKDLRKYKRNDLIIDLLHPKVISWLENTALYDISIEAHWVKSAWLFEKIHKYISNKIQQANIPSPGEGIVELISKIVSVTNHEQYWNRNLNAWVCTYKNTGETYITGIYSEYIYNNEGYIHFTMPMPGFNRTTFYRLEHGMNGSLQCTSIPRRGGSGDEGHYLMTKNFSFRFPFNEHLILWVDEYGRLQMTHRFWFLGVRVVTLEYEMVAK